MTADVFPPIFAKEKFWKPPERKEGDPRDISMLGDRRGTSLYCAVGKVTSQWEFVEMAMAGLFGELSGDTGPTSHMIYGRLTGVTVRKEVIRAVSEVYFTNEAGSALDQQITNALLAYDRASWKRNDIAHGVVAKIVNGNTDAISGHFLIPPSYATKKVSRFPLHDRETWIDNVLGQFEYALTAKDVMTQHFKFRKLDQAIRALNEAIRKWDRAGFERYPKLR